MTYTAHPYNIEHGIPCIILPTDNNPGKDWALIQTADNTRMWLPRKALHEI